MYREVNPAPQGDSSVEEWRPSIAISAVWTLLALILTLGALALLIRLDQSLSGAGGFVESTLGSIARHDDGSTVFTLNVAGAGILLASTIGVLIIHEAIHGAMFRVFGGKPRYGAAIQNKILIVLYCTAHGFHFSRTQFAFIVLAPSVLITFVGVVLMGTTGIGHWMIVPVAVNLGGSIGDIWMAGLLTQKPVGTLIEDRKDGLRFHYPPTAFGSGNQS